MSDAISAFGSQRVRGCMTIETVPVDDRRNFAEICANELIVGERASYRDCRVN